MTVATTKDTSGAALAAPNSHSPSRSRATVGRTVMVARFSKAPRVTSATAPTAKGRWARSRREAGRGGASVGGSGHGDESGS